MSTKLENWLLALVLVVAGGLRWTAVEQYESSHPLADRPVIDEQSYDRWAREIAGGEWLGREIFFQEPLYPYALGLLYAAVDGSPTVEREWARRAHVLLAVLTTFLIARCARRLFGPVAGLAGALLFAVHGPAIWFPVLLLKENLFLPLVAGFTWVLSIACESSTRRGAWFAVGALAALGSLLRGNMLVLLPCFAAFPVVAEFFAERAWRRAALASACLVLGVACVLLPVAWRNQVVGGRFVLTTSGAGTNFYGGNNLDNPYGVAKEFDFVRGVPKYEAADWRHEAERRTGRTLDPAETSSFWLGETLRSMRAEPLFHLRAFWRKFRLALGEYEVPDNHFYDWDRAFVPLLAAPWPGFAWIGGLGLAGMIAIVALRRRASPWPALGFFVSYLGTIVLTVMSERARIVLLPVIAMFAGGFVAHVLTRGAPRRASALAGLLLAVLLVAVPVYDSGQRQRDLDERDYNLATVVLADGGDLLRVRGIADALERRYPGTPRPALLSADVDYRLARRILDDPRSAPADVARARSELERIVASLSACEPRANPQERFGIAKLRGAVQQYRGEFALAEHDFRRAAEFDPEDFDVLRRLAVSLANRSMEERDVDAKRRGLAEAAEILERLVARAPDDPELARLAREVRAQL